MEVRKILVADDEKAISSYLERKLSKLGYTVLVADDGKMALEMALSYGPDLVLLDVKMPQMSGIEVCKKIKTDEKTKNCIVIMLSAKAQSKEIEAGLEAGADRYLCKPIGFPDILNEINNFDVKGN